MTARVVIEEGGRRRRRAAHVIDSTVEVEQDGVAELSARIYGHSRDAIRIHQAAILRGERGVLR